MLWKVGVRCHVDTIVGILPHERTGSQPLTAICQITAHDALDAPEGLSDELSFVLRHAQFFTLESGAAALSAVAWSHPAVRVVAPLEIQLTIKKPHALSPALAQVTHRSDEGVGKRDPCFVSSRVRIYRGTRPDVQREGEAWFDGESLQVGRVADDVFQASLKTPEVTA